MGHPYRIREIAQQAGLSEATVDRVLNGRAACGRAPSREVHQAIADLDRQRTQVRLAGRTFLVDVVMQAPAPVHHRRARGLEAELPALRPAVIRSRFHLRETAPAPTSWHARPRSRAAARRACSSRRRTSRRSPRRSRRLAARGDPGRHPRHRHARERAARLRRHRQPRRRSQRPPT